MSVEQDISNYSSVPYVTSWRVIMCKTCGALVIDTDKHTEWHEAQS